MLKNTSNEKTGVICVNYMIYYITMLHVLFSM